MHNASTNQQPMVFVVDGMLRGLVRWLRLLGFSAIPLERLEKTAKLDIDLTKYIFLTASRRHWKNWHHGKRLLLDSEDTAVQLAQLDKMTGLFEHLQPLSRCSLCNVLIQSITANEARDKVPPAVLERHDAFWQCPRCRRIYWKGGHIQRLLDKFRRMGIKL